LRRLSTDLRDVSGLEHLASLKHLQFFSVAPHAIESYDFLDRVTDRLSELELVPGNYHQVKPPKIKRSLKPLLRFKKLKRLRIDGPGKNHEILAELRGLKSLRLGDMRVPDVEPFQSHASLGELGFLGCTIGNTDGLFLMAQVEDFTIIRNVSLTDLSFLSGMT